MTSEQSGSNAGPDRSRRQRYVPAVGPRLRMLLRLVLGLFAVIGVNSAYLVSVTLAGVEYQVESIEPFE